MGSGGEEPEEEEQQYNNPRNSAAMAGLKEKSLSEKQEGKDRPYVENDGDAPLTPAVLPANYGRSMGGFSAEGENLGREDAMPVPWQFSDSPRAEEEKI